MYRAIRRYVRRGRPIQFPTAFRPARNIPCVAIRAQIAGVQYGHGAQAGHAVLRIGQHAGEITAFGNLAAAINTNLDSGVGAASQRAAQSETYLADAEARADAGSGIDVGIDARGKARDVRAKIMRVGRRRTVRIAAAPMAEGQTFAPVKPTNCAGFVSPPPSIPGAALFDSKSMNAAMFCVPAYAMTAPASPES